MLRKNGLVVGLVLVLVLAVPADAHRADLIRAGKRVGPIKLYETTLRDARRWFGEPDERTVDERGCVKRVVRLLWRGELKVFAGRYKGETHPIAEVHVLDRSIISFEHGGLTIHTRRGIQVDEHQAKVRRAYPDARHETHRGHTHYIVEDPYDRVLVKVVDREVVALEARPFEWC
ncbi:MAG TPA: hypothetical protein VNP73_04200 [Actinomycetota bacterium]|nr:hypothetical protein [Actinomycetota bacterium]